jgi:hypothetical protein
LCQQIDKRIVGFRKIKGHNKDPWNDLADSLAVKGRNQHAHQATIQAMFRAVIEGKEQHVGFPRISLSSHANIHDFWPRLVERCGDKIGNPEDYEIWQDRHKLEGPLIMGLEYEIISKTTPGFTKPSDLRKQRRNAIDNGTISGLESQPRVPKKAKEAESASPPRMRPKADVERDVPPHFRAVVTFQAHDAPEKEWRGWFTDEDTEETVVRRARNVTGIIGRGADPPSGETTRESR